MTECASEFEASDKTAKEKHMNDVVSSSYSVSEVFSSRNECTFVLNDAHGMCYCKNTIKMNLSIRKDKHKSITRKHRTKKDATTSTKKQIRLSIDALHGDCEQHTLNLAEENGESYTTLFIRDHSKEFVHDDELDTIELPSYFTKHRLLKIATSTKAG